MIFIFKEGEIDDKKKKGEEKQTKKENEELIALRAEIQKNEERQMVKLFFGGEVVKRNRLWKRK